MAMVLQDLLRNYDPMHGKPVPVSVLHDANTATAGWIERKRAEMELVSARNWARWKEEERKREEAAMYGGDPGWI